MADKFQISDDFAMYEAESAGAVAEAAKAEKRVNGINIPVGTSGKAQLVNIVAGKSKDKVDPNTKQTKPGGPMITLTDMAMTPDNVAGQKVLTYFTLSQTATQTVAQRWANFYDGMEDRGMPKELRGKPLAEIMKWAAEERTFMYEVVPHWNNKPGEKEFKALGAGGTMPSLSDLEAAGNQSVEAPWAVGDKGTCGGNPITLTAINPNGMLKIKFDATGQEMEVPPTSVVRS
jgi:hypothetical protein